MRRLLLFLSVLAVFVLVACEQKDDHPCSCGALHDVPGSPGGTSTTPAQSKIEGTAVVDGEGEGGVSDSDPGEIVIHTRSPCATDGGAYDAGDASDDAGDAGDAGTHWTERVVVHLGTLPSGGADASIDLSQAGAYAMALDPTTCTSIRIPLTGKAAAIRGDYYENAWHVSARTQRTNARAVVIEADVFHQSSSTYDYGPTAGYQECY